MMRQCVTPLIVMTTLLGPTCFGSTTSWTDPALAANRNVRFAVVSFGQDVTPETVAGDGHSGAQYALGQSGGADLGTRDKYPYTRARTTIEPPAGLNPIGHICSVHCPATSDLDGSFRLRIKDLTVLPRNGRHSDLRSTFLALAHPSEKVPFLRQMTENKESLNSHRDKANADRVTLHRHTNKELTLSVRRISNLPSVKVWVLFLCMSFQA